MTQLHHFCFDLIFILDGMLGLMLQPGVNTTEM